MKVILIKDVKGTGKAFDIRDVSGGFARNFLLPRKLAKAADAESIARVEADKIAWRKKEEETAVNLREIAGKISGKEFEFRVKTGKKGEVFGSVTREDVKKAVLVGAPDIEKESLEIELDKPIKNPGEHRVSVDLGKGVKAEIKLKITPEAE